MSVDSVGSGASRASYVAPKKAEVKGPSTHSTSSHASGKVEEKSKEIDTKDKTNISKEAEEGEEASKTEEGKGSFIDKIIDGIKDAVDKVTGKDDAETEEVKEEEKTPEEQLEELKTEDEELQEEQEAKEKEIKEKEEEIEELKEKEKKLQEELEQAIAEGDEDKVKDLMGQLKDIVGDIKDKSQEIKDLGEEVDEIKENRKENQTKQNEIQQQIDDAKKAQEAQQAQQAPASGASGGAVPASGGGGNGGGGNGGGGAAPVSGGGGSSPASGANGANGANGTNATNGAGSVNIKLTADDQKVAKFIDDYLEKHDSPAAGQGAGEMMVKYGKEYDVDPLVLLSIAGQETQYGKTGIGVNGMLGVGAYDSDPNNATRNPKFSGIENQIKVGAQTFAKLREKGGATSEDSIAKQTEAVNKAGWATDQNWHNGVTSIYNSIAQQAIDAGIAEREGGNGAAASQLAEQYLGQRTFDIQGMDNLSKHIGYNNNCANFVSACLQNTGMLDGHYNGTHGLEAALKKQGYRQVSASEAQPGDVWFNDKKGHTELVYAAAKDGNPPVLIGSNNMNGSDIQTVSLSYKSGAKGVYYHKD